MRTILHDKQKRGPFYQNFGPVHEILLSLSYSMLITILTGQFWPAAGRMAQLVICLTADTCLTADPGVASWIPAQSHTFAEIYHEIISTAILLPSADSRRVVVSYKRKYAHKVLV